MATPAVTGVIATYLTRVQDLIQNVNQTTDIDVSCTLQAAFAASDNIVYVSQQDAARLVAEAATLRGASGTNPVTISTVSHSGKVVLSATTANAYTTGERLVQTFAQTGRTPNIMQPDMVSVKDLANTAQLLTDLLDVTGALTTDAVGAANGTTLQDTGAFGDADTGHNCFLGSTVSITSGAASGETSTVTGMTDDVLTVYPPFSAQIIGGVTFNLTFDSYDDQITELLEAIPSGTVSPDAPAKNPAQQWQTAYRLLIGIHDQLAAGMASYEVYTYDDREHLMGRQNSYPRMMLMEVLAGGEASFEVSDISLLSPEGGTLELGVGTATQETITYTALQKTAGQGGGNVFQGGGPIQTGSNTQGGRGIVVGAVGAAHAVGATIELRTSTIGGSSVTLPAGAPPPPDASGIVIKQYLGNLLNQLVTVIDNWTIPA